MLGKGLIALSHAIQNHREESPLISNRTRNLSSSLRLHGPGTPSSAPIPKVAGSNPRRETQVHGDKGKSKTLITRKLLDVQ